MFSLYGIVNTCSCIFFGKLSDYLGRRLLVFAIGALSHMIIFGLLLIIWKPPLDENRIEIFVIMFICFGIGDSIFITELYATLAVFYGEMRPIEAFACLRVFHASSMAIGFIAQVYFPFSIQILYLIIVLSLSIITLIYEQYSIISLDTGKTIMSMQKQNKNTVEMETEVEGHAPLMTLSNTA